MRRLRPDCSQGLAHEFGITSASIEELLKDESIGLVINLTTPKAHVPVGLRAIDASKHTLLREATGIICRRSEASLLAARSHGVRVGCAPDTFLGGGQQTARNLVDSDAIGTPIGGTAFVLLPGHELWHPNPDFYYQDDEYDVYCVRTPRLIPEIY